MNAMVKLQSHPEGRCHVARFTCLVYISLVLKLPLNCQQPGLTKELKGSQITRWPGGKTDEAIHVSWQPCMETMQKPPIVICHRCNKDTQAVTSL